MLSPLHAMVAAVLEPGDDILSSEEVARAVVRAFPGTQVCHGSVESFLLGSSRVVSRYRYGLTIRGRLVEPTAHARMAVRRAELAYADYKPACIDGEPAF